MENLSFRKWLVREGEGEKTEVDKKVKEFGRKVAKQQKVAEKKRLTKKILQSANDTELAAAVDEFLAQGHRFVNHDSKDLNIHRWLSEQQRSEHVFISKKRNVISLLAFMGLLHR